MDPVAEILQQLTDRGIPCCRAMPNIRQPLLSEPTVFAEVLETSLEPGFAGNFMYFDEENQSCHGVKADTTLFFDIYSPYRMGAPACVEMRDRVRDVLMGCFDRYTVRNMTCSSCSYNPKSDYFRCRITLKLETWFSIEGRGGETA